MQSKMVFYEGSVHIPLILRLPGIIPSGKVVDEPVSNMALFGTITDYLGLPAAAPPTSKSLRPLIEGSRDSADAADDDRVVFSFWDSDISPGFMAFDGRFKLMIGRQEKTDASRCCSPDVQCMIPAHDEIDVDYRTVPCEVDAQGFDAPGVDALYDHLYDPKVGPRVAHLCPPSPPFNSSAVPVCLYLTTGSIARLPRSLLCSGGNQSSAQPVCTNARWPLSPQAASSG